MGARRLLILLLAVGVAGAAAMYARSWIASQQTSISAQAAPVPVQRETGVEVLVAEIPLAAGTFVKPQHLRWQRWPDDDLPETFLVREERSEDDMVGAVVRRAILAGTPLTDAAVVKPGDRGFLAAVLSPGMRAISVPINPTSANSGLIFPGDRVDMILTQAITPDEDAPTRRVSETVLTDVLVIAMGDHVSDRVEEGKSFEKARTATLEVTPEQAEIVTLVTELGKLSLSLRSLANEAETDAAAADVPGQSFTWDSDASRVLGSSAANMSRLTVLRGSSAEDVQVQKGAD